jgi:hypothetical protein
MYMGFSQYRFEKIPTKAKLVQPGLLEGLRVNVFRLLANALN